MWTFVSKVMSVLFNTLFRFVIAYLPSSKHLLILWLWSPSAVILESKEIKSVTVSIVFPSIFHEVMGLDAMILVFLKVEYYASFSILLFHFHQEALKFLFNFCHKDSVISISEVIDIFLAILIPACASLSPAFCMMYFTFILNK